MLRDEAVGAGGSLPDIAVLATRSAGLQRPTRTVLRGFTTKAYEPLRMADASCPDGFLSPLFTWRSAISSPYGPKSPVTRHVLLALSLHMNERGGSCFPSTRLLEEETGLSRRSVETHLKHAEDEGWLERRQLGMAGQKWRRMQYRALVPKAAKQGLLKLEQELEKGGEPDAPEGGERGAPPSAKVGNVVQEGGERRSPEVVSEDVKLRDRSSSKAKQRTYSPEFEELWAVHPRGSKEKAAAEWLRVTTPPPSIAPATLLACLRLYVRVEISDRFRGHDLFRWIRDERWREYEDQAGETVAVKEFDDSWRVAESGGGARVL